MVSLIEPQDGWIRVHDVLDLMPGFVCLLKPDYSIRSVNASFREIFGDSKSSPCFQVFFHREAPCENCPARQAFETRRPQRWEWQGEDKRTFLMHAIPFTDADGGILVVLAGIDISEQKRIESELRQKEERLRKVADFTYDWEYWLGPDGALIYISPSCERVTGYSPQAFLENPKLLFSIVHPEDLARLEKHGREELENTAEAFAIDFRLRTADGKERWIGHVCQPVSDSNGVTLGRRVSNRDITDRKEAEHALIHTERLAAMGRLVATLAHEINNPLQALSNSVELMLDFPLEEEEKKAYLKTIEEEIQRLKDITAGILDFARPRETEKKPVHIEEIIQQALALAKKQLAHANITVISRLAENLPAIKASPSQLAQVFLNLIINAVENMPDGGIMTIVSSFDQEWIKISFSDTGKGIPEDKINLIFEPFYSTKDNGTGLGLAISQNIVAQHMGRMTVENLPDRGAVFTIHLPIYRYDAAASERLYEQPTRNFPTRRKNLNRRRRSKHL